jgi:hypothetical protein
MISTIKRIFNQVSNFIENSEGFNIIITMSKRLYSNLAFLPLLILVASFLSTCAQDFYADIPCTSNSECPKGYHCEANEQGNMVCVKGEAEQISGVSVIPDEINFGDVQVKDKKIEQITITNKSVSKAKVNIALDFASKSDELSLEKKTLTVNYNETAKVGVIYSPKKVGSLPPNKLNVFLVVGSNSQNVKALPLYGKGIDPNIVAEPTTIDFGELYPGNKSEPKTVSISNSTGGALKVTNIYILENKDVDAGDSDISEFELIDLPSLPYALNEKGSFFEIKVQFKPKTAGDKIASLVIENTDVDNPRLTVQLMGKGGSCPPNYYDINGKPEDGCEYYCNPKLRGVEICDGEDNDCDGEIDNNPNEEELCQFDNKASKHVVHLSCIEKEGKKRCIITECEPNYWDLDSEMDNGCEAICEKTGPEVCDGKDNDCNGKTDEINPNMMCPAVPNTTDAMCIQGRCEYTCALKYGNCNNDWSDGCETRLQDNDDNCGECGKRCDLPNAIGRCEDVQCKIVSCKSGYYDINKDPKDGCEYQCTPQGQEKCNGIDDDCDGNTDNGDIRILCPTASNTTYACENGKCKIVACGNGWYDLNGNIEDGCECQAYSSLPGGDTCESATDLGSFDSPTQSYTLQTNLLPVGKVAFYKARFVDNLEEDITNGRDNFHITIRIENNPQNQYRMDIYEDSCSPSGKYHLYQNCAQQDYSFATDFRDGSGVGATGENPCYGSGNVPNKNLCSNNSMWVIFKIYRDPNITPTCETASIRINFTR